MYKSLFQEHNNSLGYRQKMETLLSASAPNIEMSVLSCLRILDTIYGYYKVSSRNKYFNIYFGYLILCVSVLHYIKTKVLLSFSRPYHKYWCLSMT